jgi:hypothetical protein
METMTDPLTIVVNTFEPKDDGYRERQRYAMKRLYEIAPGWVSIWEARLQYDLPVQDRSEKAHYPLALKRDSAEILGSKRHLPFVKEIMTWASLIHGSGPGFFGMMNNDNIVSPEFFEKIRSKLGKKTVIVGRVWDLKDVDEFPNRRDGEQYGSIDAFFINNSIIDLFEQTYPDFTMTDGWDTCAMLWVRRYKEARPLLIDDGSLLHVWHEKEWWARKGMICSAHNKKLLDKFEARK